MAPSMNATFNTIRQSVASVGSTGNAALHTCIINSINTNNLTAEIYVPDFSAVLYNVPLSFPNKGHGYGSFLMPRNGSMCLLAITNQGKPYVLTSTTMSSNEDTSSADLKDRPMPGENIIQSYGKAYMKQNIAGDHIAGSAIGNIFALQRDGTNRSFGIGKEERTVASKLISGFGIAGNAVPGGNLFNGADSKVLQYEEYYSRISLPKFYDISNIIEIVNGKQQINVSVRDSILNAAQTTINKITDPDKGFYVRIKNLQLEMQDGLISEQEIADKVTSYLASAKADFNIARKGSKIVIEKGNALNDGVDTINDVFGLSGADFATTGTGADISLRVTVKDAETDAEKLCITVDAEGACYISAKKLDIRVGQDGFNLTEE